MTLTSGNENGAPSTDILALALDIVNHAANIKTQLGSLPAPNFTPDSPDLPDTPELNALRSRLVASIDDLRLLVVGPRRSMRSLICSSNDLAALQVAFEFNFFTIVPESEEGISLEEVARQAGIDEGRTRQVLRFLCTHRIFREVKEGWFAHTASSAAFRRDENLRSAGYYAMDEMFKAASSTADCIKESPQDSDLVHSPFKTRLGATMFDYYEQNPAHAARFAKAMAGVASVDRKTSTLADRFPWDTLKGTIVDVGGGSGHVAIDLARRFSHLNFLVEDGVADMLVEGKRILATEDPAVAGRIELLQHDFFQPQPERVTAQTPVAAFFLRHVFHNWNDADSIAIARALVPALEAAAPETPVIISDRVLPRPGTGVPLYEERAMRQMDVMMLVGLGAKERTRAEFETLFKAADERLVVKEVHGEGASALVEVVLRK